MDVSNAVFVCFTAALLLMAAAPSHGQDCQAKAVFCTTPILPLASKLSGQQPDASVLASLCKVLPEVEDCINNLSDDCKNSETVKNITAGFKTYSTFCGTEGKPLCIQAVACFMSLTSNPSDCRANTALVTCLKNLKDTCTFDESKVTLNNLQSWTSELCNKIPKDPPNYRTCAAVNFCLMNSTKLNLQQLLSSAGDPSAIPNLVSKITDPAFLCQYMEVVVDCLVSQSDTCQTSGNTTFMNTIRAEQEAFDKRCKGQTGDGSGGERPAAYLLPMVLALLTTLYAVL